MRCTQPPTATKPALQGILKAKPPPQSILKVKTAPQGFLHPTHGGSQHPAQFEDALRKKHPSQAGIDLSRYTGHGLQGRGDGPRAARRPSSAGSLPAGSGAAAGAPKQHDPGARQPPPHKAAPGALRPKERHALGAFKPGAHKRAPAENNIFFNASMAVRDARGERGGPGAGQTAAAGGRGAIAAGGVLKTSKPINRRALLVSGPTKASVKSVKAKSSWAPAPGRRASQPPKSILKSNSKVRRTGANPFAKPAAGAGASRPSSGKPFRPGTGIKRPSTDRDAAAAAAAKARGKALGDQHRGPPRPGAAHGASGVHTARDGGAPDKRGGAAEPPLARKRHVDRDAREPPLSSSWSQQRTEGGGVLDTDPGNRKPKRSVARRAGQLQYTHAIAMGARG